jgi:hypothetical protein
MDSAGKRKNTEGTARGKRKLEEQSAGRDSKRPKLEDDLTTQDTQQSKQPTQSGPSLSGPSTESGPSQPNHKGPAPRAGDSQPGPFQRTSLGPVARLGNTQPGPSQRTSLGPVARLGNTQPGPSQRTSLGPPPRQWDERPYHFQRTFVRPAPLILDYLDGQSEPNPMGPEPSTGDPEYRFLPFPSRFYASPPVPWGLEPHPLRPARIPHRELTPLIPPYWLGPFQYGHLQPSPFGYPPRYGNYELQIFPRMPSMPPLSRPRGVVLNTSLGPVNTIYSLPIFAPNLGTNVELAPRPGDTQPGPSQPTSTGPAPPVAGPSSESAPSQPTPLGPAPSVAGPSSESAPSQPRTPPLGDSPPSLDGNEGYSPPQPLLGEGFGEPPPQNHHF